MLLTWPTTTQWQKFVIETNGHYLYIKVSKTTSLTENRFLLFLNVNQNLVNAMAKTFAILGQGSSFMHGSNTKNGESADGRINDLFTYVAYQAAVQNLGAKDNFIIHDLSYSKR